MKIASLVFLILFVVSSLIHLYFCYIENEKWRHRTKPVCLFLLALAAVFYAPKEPLIYIGALLGMGGDIFLLRKKEKISFFIGMILFISGHILYLVAIAKGFNGGLPYYIYLAVFGGLFLLSFVLYPFTSKIVKGPIAFVGNIYMVLLLVLLGFGIALAIVNKEHILSGILFACGYLSFFISDTILTFTTFKVDIKRRDFYIMFFYLLAEALIVSSLCLLLG
ncbi:MAG: lysoplasmalogenase [Bacilli bacterium]|nr:lysoplasmalogenase [Bacilli bacterium]